MAVKIRRKEYRAGARKRKGSLEETISYAMHHDEPANYIVAYRDKDVIKKTTLQEFMKGEEFSTIPLTRIYQITRNNDEIVWRKGQKELLVKKSAN